MKYILECRIGDKPFNILTFEADHDADNMQFGRNDGFIAIISKIDEGNFVYHLKLAHDIKSELCRWLFNINAYNETWTLYFVSDPDTLYNKRTKIYGPCVVRRVNALDKLN